MRKRSKYRPRGVQPAPLDWVLQGFKRTPDVDVNVTVRTVNHLAMDSLAHGSATRSDVNAIAAFVNIACALAEKGKGREYWAELAAGSDAIYDIARKGAATGRFLATGPQLSALNLALEIHDAQMDASLVLEVEAALTLIRNRKAAGVGRYLFTQSNQTC